MNVVKGGVHVGLHVVCMMKKIEELEKKVNSMKKVKKTATNKNKK